MTHNDHANTPNPGLSGGPNRQAMFAEFIRSGIQQLIEAELTAALGAGRYERTDTRTTHRNGTRPKTLATASGDIELAIPKLRQGSFFPALLERRRRIDQALHAVIMEAYVHGVSTRNVDDLVAALGVASGISKSEVSRILRWPGRRGRRIPRTHGEPHHLPLRVLGCDVLQGAGRCARRFAGDGRGHGRVHRRLP